MVAYGRRVEHDVQSFSFAHSPPVKLQKKTTLWAHHAPVLDQGDLGSCTGNALTQCLNTDFFAPAREALKRRYLTETDAVALYSAATRFDEDPEHYPPTDTGSSGLAVCKAGKQAGYLTSYRHAFSFNGFLSALQTQPLIVGTAFYAQMEDPDKSGLVKPGGDVAGGHEYLALGVDYQTNLLTFLNSWSDGWGVKGRFHMTLTDFSALLADQGDATLPVGVKA